MEEKQQLEKQKQEEESKRQFLIQILTSEARERRMSHDYHLFINSLVSRIHLVKPEKAKTIEDYLISMARTGKIREKISEEMLIQLLEQVTKQEQSQAAKIIVQRRGSDDFDLSEFGI